MKRSPIRRVSKKRKQALTEYYKRRIRYLRENPYCQLFLKYYNLTKDDVDPFTGLVIIRYGGFRCSAIAPKATEIHHTKKPKATYLNDESTWLSASREWHEWVESHKKEAREKGLLENI